MAKFIFRLQGVLNIKQKLEDQEKISYGLARAKLNEEEERLKALYVRKDELMAYKQHVMEKLDIRELNLAENAINGNDLQIENQKKQVIRAERALDAAQQKLEAAMKERKTYEKLRENAYEQFLQDMNREEQLEINELVSFRHGKDEE